MKVYDIEIKENQAIIRRNSDGQIVYRSKHFRYRWEAQENADKWVQQHLVNPVTLEVQNLSIDANTLLGGKKNG